MGLVNSILKQSTAALSRYAGANGGGLGSAAASPAQQAPLEELPSELQRKIAEHLPPAAAANLSAANKSMHGTISSHLKKERALYQEKERQLHQEIDAFSGVEHGMPRLQELLGKLDEMPGKSQSKALVALMQKVDQFPRGDRLAAFRAIAIAGSHLQSQNRNAVQQAMERQSEGMPPLELVSAHTIFSMYCSGQIPQQADWREPALARNLDELPPSQQLPAVHAALHTISQWKPEHREPVIGTLAATLPHLRGNEVEALRVVLDSAEQLPKRSYEGLLYLMEDRQDAFPDAVRPAVSAELIDRFARLPR